MGLAVPVDDSTSPSSGPLETGTLLLLLLLMVGDGEGNNSQSLSVVAVTMLYTVLHPRLLQPSSHGNER